MSKIAIMTDSNSGITQKQAEEMGISVLPMPFMIDGQTYLEGVSLTHEEFYEKLEAGADISTSQPSPESVMDMWRKLLKDHDEVVHIPMSSGLSGSCQTAIMLSNEEEFEGKVHVVNNQRISVTQRQSVLDAIRLSEEGKTADEIKEILEEDKLNSSIYIMLDTLYYLKKGGRITPAAAALGTLLKLKPVLQIQGEKLDAFAKARTKNQGKSIMLTAMENDIKNRFGGLSEDDEELDVHLQMAYTKDLEAANAFKEEVAAKFPGNEICMDPLSLSVACHIGPGALAVAVTKKLK
ncbi:MAG: DegV family protein [Lachnospiraceae bacterium]|nr:DegV family protein [Lachnospiraceae bacterium]